MKELEWLPKKPADWNARVRALESRGHNQALWEECERLSLHQLDFVDTSKLDRAIQRLKSCGALAAVSPRPMFRLAVLGSSTLQHLVPGLRIGCLRRGIDLTVYIGEYGQYRQELMSPTALNQFGPDAVLLALDPYHLAERSAGAPLIDTLRACWRQIREMGAVPIQQTALPVHPHVIGTNEHVMHDSPATIVDSFNAEIRKEPGLLVLSIDAVAARQGVDEWHDPVLWHRAKQEISPRVSHIYGDSAGRLISALRGRSKKCLVLDLDNTVWGGVVGEAGLEGLQLGQGTALGEAYVSFQQYAARLSRRGVILAVCSKNDEDIALHAFSNHPEMVLKASDCACFVANWNDKPSNLRSIADRLNIGTDSLVFADDNPYERNLVRREMPEVAVPELPEDPALYAQVIADAGYFETTAITEDDRSRAQQYGANAARERLRHGNTDLADYLRELDMELTVRGFDSPSIPRLLQLVNKTNQFNLTTPRYMEEELRAMASDRQVITLQFRLRDRFGDNGTIAVMIGKQTSDAVTIDSWLMSCRVLGRTVEHACLSVMADLARSMGATKLVGMYKPTKRNGIVRDLYAQLGFARSCSLADDTITAWELSLPTWRPPALLMQVRQEIEAVPSNSREPVHKIG